MKQILQHLGNGETMLADVPCPQRDAGAVLCRTRRTLVSLGTERMLVDFAKSGWIERARSQPERVKQVIQKLRTDGLRTTVEAVRARLDTPLPLGYCHTGVIEEADADSRYRRGDRVITNGPHAEMVAVPEHLVAGIPDGVSDDAAAFTVVGAIGLQGIRLLEPTLGERVVVSGLGLIGLLAVQLLRANGCRVLGIDPDPRKLELARGFGAETVDLSAGQDPIRAGLHWSNGDGVDAVLITASTKSDEVIHQAASMCRKRGRIVLVGVVGLQLNRADFYEKELSFRVSCSYGPGRYDPAYEQQGLDYPIGFVRWTEQRNFRAVLDLLADGKLDVAPLITHRFPFVEALRGYEAFDDPGALGILLEYETTDDAAVLDRSRTATIALGTAPTARAEGKPGVAVIGAGTFATRMLLPRLSGGHVDGRTVVSATGVSATHAATKFGFANASTDVEAVWSDPDVDAVFVTTRHDTHADLVVAGLRAGKHVFVEKPLALTPEQLEAVRSAMQAHPERCVTVGFNRRFSPHTLALSEWLAAVPSSKAIVITVNAGSLPDDHWTQDPALGGGRIAGEACHFIDLARAIAGAPIREASATAMTGGDGRNGDCASIQLTFEDGSIATIHYLANGSRDFPKERVEVFAGGRIAVIDNFRRSHVVGGKQRLKTGDQDKGHAAGFAAFLEAVSTGGAWPIPADELIEVARVTLDVARQVRGQVAR